MHYVKYASILVHFLQIYFGCYMFIFYIFLYQPAFSCSKLKIDALEQGLKYAKS